MMAFQRAADLWRADMIELDVHASADGHCVVIHDPTLERTTNGSGTVASHTLAQLQTLDAGYRFTPDNGRTYPFRGQGARIPTLDEALQAWPEMRLTVELKTAAAQRPLFAAIAQANATDRVIVAGEYRRFRTEFGNYRGCISAAREDAVLYYVLHRLRLGRLARVPAQVVQTCELLGQRRVVTPRLIDELHRKAIAVHVWTVNELEDMRRLLEWDVDGVLTDRPDRLARVLHERVGRPLPPGLAHTQRESGASF